MINATFCPSVPLTSLSAHQNALAVFLLQNAVRHLQLNPPSPRHNKAVYWGDTNP